MKFHNEGRAAFYEGIGSLGSPYMDWERRSQWVKGWYDAQHEALLTPKGIVERPASAFSPEPRCL